MRIIATFMIMALAFLAAGATLSLVNPVVAKPNRPTNPIIFADLAHYSEWKTGWRFTGISLGIIMFGICTALLISYRLNKRVTIQMAQEPAERRKAAAFKKAGIATA